MKIKITFFLIILIVSSFAPNRQIDDFCEVYGIVYFESNKYAADAIVFIQEDETQSELHVFKEDNRLFADEEGVWYVTENPALAHFKLYKEKDERNADFSISFIEDRAFVGCQ